MLVGFVRLVLALAQAPSISAAPSSFWIATAGRVFAFAILTFTLFSLHFRKGLARLSGAFAIAVLFAAYVNHVFINPSPGVIPRLQYDNPAFGYTVERIFDFLFASLLLYWIYAYAFSRKAKAFFGGENAA
jgi:hypothetical protein